MRRSDAILACLLTSVVLLASALLLSGLLDDMAGSVL